MIKKIIFLYFSPYSFFHWINRGIFIGILLSIYFFSETFYGEFNLLYPVAENLLPATLLGALFYELGAWIVPFGRKNFSNNITPVSYLTPWILWCIALLATVILFSFSDIPLLTDPKTRASLGQGSGLLKRLMEVFLPVATLEIVALHQVVRKKLLLIDVIICIITLSVFFITTAKAPLFFFLIFLFILVSKNYENYEMDFKSIKFNIMALFLMLIFTAYLYAIYASDEDFFVIMGTRISNLVSQMPNYILLGNIDIPNATDLMRYYLDSVLWLFRMAEAPKSLENTISEIILGRYVDVGGLSPTVIGEGWIFCGFMGIALLSFIYGIIAAFAIRNVRNSMNPFTAAISCYTAFIVFYLIQFFSVPTLLDKGVSLLLYIVFHCILDKICTAIIVFKDTSFEDRPAC